MLLSYVTLCDFHPIYMTDANTSLGLVISIPEVVLIIWFCTLAMDEVRKVSLTPLTMSILSKLYSILSVVYHREKKIKSKAALLLGQLVELAQSNWSIYLLCEHDSSIHTGR